MWYVFEYLAMAALAVVIVTQVLVPIARGTKTFPWLRRSKLEAKLVDAAEAADLQLMNDLLDEISRNIKASKAAALRAEKEATNKDE